MSVARREGLLARLGHAYVVYAKQDKHVNYRNVKAIAARGVGTIIVLPMQCPVVAKCLASATINLLITDEVKCLTSMVATKYLNDTPSFAAMHKLACKAKRLVFLDADFFLGNQPLNFAHLLLMGRECTQDRLVIHKFMKVKSELQRDIALFHSTVPPTVEAAWLHKLNARMRAMGKPTVDTCGTTKHFEFILSSIKVFIQSTQGKYFKVFVTCSSRVRANTETCNALRAQLRATAYTTNTHAQRAHEEMKTIDEFFNRMQFITASSTIDVGIDSLVHFPFIIAITKGGTSSPSAHLQAMYRVSRILSMKFTLLWCIDEPMPKPEKRLSVPHGNLALGTITDKQRLHATAGTGAPPMHPKLVAIWTENAQETQWNAAEHAVLVRETLLQNPCYRIIEPCGIMLPDGVFDVTARDVSVMIDAYADVSPSGMVNLFADARDVALEVSAPLERHKHSLSHFRGAVMQLVLADPTLSQADAEHVVLINCDGAVGDVHADADLAKLDAGTLESCLLDTWKVVRFTGLAVVDETIVTEMDGSMGKYLLGVASLKGHLAVEHHMENDGVSMAVGTWFGRGVACARLRATLPGSLIGGHLRCLGRHIFLACRLDRRRQRHLLTLREMHSSETAKVGLDAQTAAVRAI